MRCRPVKKPCFTRFSLPVILLLCLAFLSVSAEAATTGRVSITTTTSPLIVQRVITTPTTVPAPQTAACVAPCRCMERSAAVETWGDGGFTQCQELPCEYGRSASGAPLEKYCFLQKQVTTTATTVIPVRPVPLTTVPTFTTPIPARVTTTVTTTTTPAEPKTTGEKMAASETPLYNQQPGNTSATCAVDHGAGKGLPDSEVETQCINICEDIPMKPQPGKDDLIKIFERLKKDHGFFSQVVTHPRDAYDMSDIRLSQKQIVLISSLSESELRSGFTGLPSEIQQQLENTASGNEMTSSVCYGEQCTTKPAPDGIPDLCDNCPTVQNADQTDIDGDGYGDVCDNCAKDKNNQSDSDHDNIGDTCDICPGVGCTDIYGNPDNGDDDNDGKGNCCDNCRKNYNPGQEDNDGDGIGNACDTCWDSSITSDIDGECNVIKKKAGYWNDISGWQKDPMCCDAYDNCPTKQNLDHADADNDGLGDACDPCQNNQNVDPTDTDSDGVPDACDNCPLAFSYFQYDADGDGIGDACDCNDGVKGFYEISTDCGVRKSIPGNDPRIDKSIATGTTGCANLPCSPCMSINENLPGNFTWTSWRGKFWMSPVQNQGSCGSCWVMAPIGSIEGMYNIHTGNGQYDFLGDTVYKRMIDMSESYVWNNAPGNGCSGGQHLNSMNFINAYGVPNETFSSAGASVDGTPQDPKRWYISGVASVQGDYYGSLDDAKDDPDPGRKVASALTCYGPLSVCDPSWEHCVTLVGWDSSKFNGRGGWLVKNSWGYSWPDANMTHNPDRPDYWLDPIPGLGGYAYIPANPVDFNQDLLNQMWADRYILHTGAKTYQGTWYYKDPKV